jgi:hypothetical protein
MLASKRFIKSNQYKELVVSILPLENELVL